MANTDCRRTPLSVLQYLQQHFSLLGFSETPFWSRFICAKCMTLHPRITFPRELLSCSSLPRSALRLLQTHWPIGLHLRWCNSDVKARCTCCWVGHVPNPLQVVAPLPVTPFLRHGTKEHKDNPIYRSLISFLS